MSKSPSSASQETSELLIEAAGPIFAENGFHATTVRQITQAAGANLAAVNYHFRDKQELYVSVLKHAYQTAARTAEADRAGAPDKRLRAFIHGFLGYLLDPQRPEWQGRLIARELAQPTQALDQLVRESVQPVKKRISGIVRSILGPTVPDSDVRLACFSIIGQCLFYVHCREMTVRLFPEERNIRRDIDTLTDHVFQFSLAGLNAVRRNSGSGQKTARRPSSPKSKTKKTS